MKSLQWLTLIVLAILIAGCGKSRTDESAFVDQAPAAVTPDASGGASTPAAVDVQKAPVLNKIKLDVKAGRIEITGIVCSKEGILDFLAVISGGREYESVLALDGKGSLLNLDLLALGAEPGPTQELLDAMKKEAKEGDKLPAKIGTALRITAEWQKDGKTVSVPATQLMIDRKTKKPVADGVWIFTGSYFIKDEKANKDFYAADEDEALIGVRYMRDAVINFEKDLGDPYIAADAGCEVNKELAPDHGTAVKLIIELANPPAK